MSEPKHTPGPWKWSEDRCLLIPVGRYPQVLALDLPEFMLEEDKQLIAAAPDLLAACKTVMEWNDRVGAMCTSSDMRDVLTPLMDAIAKAEGR